MIFKKIKRMEQIEWETPKVLPEAA